MDRVGNGSRASAHGSRESRRAAATRHGRWRRRLGLPRSADVEVCLLWLDELDDIVFVLASLCHRLRRVYLLIGLVAALTLVGVELVHEAPRWSSALAGIAGASVALWSFVALAFLAQRLGPRAVPARA